MGFIVAPPRPSLLERLLDVFGRELHFRFPVVY